MGVTLPVATTLLARSPFSTLASFVGSILVPPRVAANTPIAISRTIPNPTPPQIISLRRFFLPLVTLPFTDPPHSSCRQLKIGSQLPPLIACTRPAQI